MALKCKCHLDENRACHLDKHNQQFFLRETEQERGGFAAMPRLSKSPPESIRFAGLLPDSEVIQRIEIAESPVKRAFRGVCPYRCSSSSSLRKRSMRFMHAPDPSRQWNGACLASRHRESHHGCLAAYTEAPRDRVLASRSLDSHSRSQPKVYLWGPASICKIYSSTVCPSAAYYTTHLQIGGERNTWSQIFQKSRHAAPLCCAASLDFEILSGLLRVRGCFRQCVAIPPRCCGRPE